jgi:hypothetical protein
MDIHINTDEKIQIDYLTLQKMAFLFNALEDGWQIKKNKENPAPRFAERGWLLSYRFDSSSTKPSIVSYIKVSTSFKVNVFFKFMK